MEILLLTTTAQHATSNPNVILDPKSLKKWIDSLSGTDLPRIVSQLHTAIENLNELVVDDKRRLKLLQVYYDSLQDILLSCDEIRINMLPISVQQRNKLREDVMWLYLSLANGYKHIVKNYFDKKILPGKDPVLLYAVYSAMELIAEGLIYSYRAHLSPPPLARLEVNQLFYYAFMNKVTDIPIKGRKGHVSLPTINRLYKQHVLMFVSNPYRLNPTDMLDLFLFLESIADNCLMQLGQAGSAMEGKYRVDLLSDDDPAPCVEVGMSGMTEQTLVIDIWPIVNILAARTAEHDVNKQSFLELQERHMIDIIIEQIGRHTPYKEASWVDIQQPVHAVHGINALNHVLAQKTSSEVDYIKWVIQKKNKNDYMLLAMNPESLPEIMVGDVIGIIRDEGKLIIGVTQWLKREQGDTLKLGIKVIGDYAEPVLYEIESGYGVDLAEDSEYPGLYFPQHKANHDAALLIRKEHYSKDRNLYVHRGNERFQANVAALLVDSPFYIQLKLK